MRSNQDYKNAALTALKGKWTPSVLCTLVYFAISSVPYAFSGTESVASFFISLACSICVLMPLGVGFYAALRGLYLEGDERVIENTFRIGFGNWVHHVSGMLLVAVFTFLWTLLLIIPGIVKGLAYTLTPFILKEKPELSPNEAIELSMKMMDGHKWDFFLLCLSFIGWYLLSIFTLCIGLLWVMPYQYTTIVAFYEDVKAEYESKQVSVA